MKRIFIEQEKCDGCKNCSLACMQAHRADSGSLYDLDLTDPANESRNFILLDSKNNYIPIFCRHCDDPKCVTSCMSGAMSKNPENGLVEYDKEKCAECFMCVMNCPYGVLKPSSAGNKIIKCDFCINDNMEPNCVKACPKKAIYVQEVS